MKKFIAITFYLAVFFGLVLVAARAEDEVVVAPYDDLLVEDIVTVPANPAINQECWVKVLVKNNGTKNLYSSTGFGDFSYSFPNFAITQASTTLPSLSAPVMVGGYANFEYLGSFTSGGEKSLSFTINKLNAFSEKDEANNTKIKVITIGDNKPDLVVSAFTLTPEKILINSEVTLKVTVKNSGIGGVTSCAGLARGDVFTDFKNFDISSATYPVCPTLVSPLETDGILEYVYTGKFNRAGENIMTFTADKTFQLAEANEANNASSTKAIVYINYDDADEFKIINDAVWPISSSSVKIVWENSKIATGKVNYQLSNRLFAEMTAVNDTPSFSQSVILENLIPGETYLYKAIAINNTALKETAEKTFTTFRYDDLYLTADPAVITDGAKKTATVSWETNLISNSSVFYKKSGASDYLSVSSDILALKHEIKLENLDLGKYDYYIISTSSPLTVMKKTGLTFEVKAVTNIGSSSGSASLQNSSQPASSASAKVNLSKFSVTNSSLFPLLKGKIILRSQSKGEAYFINAQDRKAYFLGKPEDAFEVIRSLGRGILNSDLNKIPIGLGELSGSDSDNDGLPDSLETAIGTDKSKADTDGDGFGDKTEVVNGYDPNMKAKKTGADFNFAKAQAGKIFLQVQGKGEAWYVNPKDNKRYFLGRAADAFNLMRKLGLGVSEKDFSKL